jgi:hypothetical protein
MSNRLTRTILILATTAGLAASAGTASAAPKSDGPSGRDNAPGGQVTKADDHRPAGAGHGRKVG